jgi:hypothetical protein
VSSDRLRDCRFCLIAGAADAVELSIRCEDAWPTTTDSKGERMASNEWWTDDDPAVFGPVVVEVKVGEIPRAQGTYRYAKWESEQHLKPGVEREESLLLLDSAGQTIVIPAGYVLQVERPQGKPAGKVLLDETWRKGAMTTTRGPATPGSN